MNQDDLKNNASFQRALRPWKKKHQSSKYNPIFTNDFKLLHFKNKIGLIMDSGPKPESFVVCTVDQKLLRTYITVASGKVLSPVLKSFKERRKTLKDFIDHITDGEWEYGKIDGYASLYSSNPHVFIGAFSQIEKKPLKEFLNVLEYAYRKANDLYNSGRAESFLTDDEFDELQKILYANGIFSESKSVGTPQTKGAVTLPNMMPSLEFEKTSDKISEWVRKNKINDLIYEPKVDGISLQLIYKSGNLERAFIRGDGFEAEDKTYVAREIPAIPKKLKKDMSPEIRVEAYMDDKVFEAKYSLTSGGKYKFKTARNTVAGMFNRNVPAKEILKDIKILAFRAFKGVEYKTHTEELNKLSELGFPVVAAKPLAIANIKNLPKILTETRANHLYSMDGLVLLPNKVSDHERIGTETNSINPRYSRAFKPISEDQAQSTVKSIRWTLSDSGYIKPTAIIEPVTIKGVTVSKTNLFNADNVISLKIGPGAVILVSRRGDVIPYLEKVVEPAKKADISGAAQFGEYEWSEKKVDFVLKQGVESDERNIQLIIHFFNALKVEYFDEGMVRRFYKGGFKTPKDIMEADDKEMQELGGFQEKAIQRVRSEFAKLKNPGVTLPQFMFASRMFGRGFGKDKLNMIYEQYGDDCLYGWEDFSLREIATALDRDVRGLSYATGVQFAKGILPFVKFAKQYKNLIYIKKPKEATGSKLAGKIIYITGFRNKEISDFIVDQGGKEASSFGNSVNLLIIKNESTSNDKTKRAEKTNVQVMTESAFKRLYMTSGGL